MTAPANPAPEGTELNIASTESKLAHLNGEIIKLLKKDSLVAIVLDESFARQYRRDALNQLLINEYHAAHALAARRREQA